MVRSSASARTAVEDLVVPASVRRRLSASLVADSPPHMLVVGPSGSGKSTVLRALARDLIASGRPVVSAHRGLDLSTPQDEILIVDDAHLLDDARWDTLRKRLDRDDAGLIIAVRPEPLAGLRDVVDALERSGPPVLLGQLTAADLMDQVDTRRLDIAPACARSIISATGGIAWLAVEAAHAHAGVACEEGCSLELAGIVELAVLHRLAGLDDDVRRAMQAASFGPSEPARMDRSAAAGSAYAAGLATGAGVIPAAIRSAVCASAAAADVVELYAAVPDAEGALRSAVEALRGPHSAGLLVDRGDEVMAADPARAAELFAAAGRVGAPRDLLAVRRAHAAWALGDLDAAYGWLDRSPLPLDHPDHDAAARAAAAIWASRGFLHIADETYRSAGGSGALRAITAIGVGDRSGALAAGRRERAGALPSTQAIADDLLVHGLELSLADRCEDAVAELGRASRVASSARAHEPSAEPAAVVASVAAAHLGRPHVAAAVLDEAVSARQDGLGTKDHLLLWQALVAAQSSRPALAREGLAAVESSPRPLSARDEMLAHAVRVALSRRYDDLPALERAWAAAEPSVSRVRLDLFGILPLLEFGAAAVKVGDPAWAQRQLAEAAAMIDALDSPLWSPLVHWGAIQQSILMDRPQDLKPHARALIASSATNPLAHALALAGRVWTDVFTGHVDVKQVEDGSLRLAKVGLPWDGARLAVHAAAKTDDRKTVARLLAVARQIHPKDETKPSATAPSAETPTNDGPAPSDAGSVLSAREREVAALVVQGKTYVEIGQAIFISPRTAEHHIARIRRRLEATTRSDLVAKLRAILDDAGSRRG